MVASRAAEATERGAFSLFIPAGEHDMSRLKDAAKYLSLSEALNSLKDELIKADSMARANDDAVLLFKECEVELSLEFEPKVEAGFNIGLFKVTAGAGATGGHKIKVRYEANRPLVAFAGDKNEAVPGELGPAQHVVKARTRAKAGSVAEAKNKNASRR